MRFTAAYTLLVLLVAGSSGAHGSTCSDNGDCTSCLDQNGCTWFEDIQYCETGCGMDGCGASVCPSELTTCTECLGGPGTEASGQYSWTPDAGVAGECLGSCDEAPADGSCYKAKSSVDPSGYDPDICPSISVCRQKTSCVDCLEGGACAWSEGNCYDSCMDLDVPMDTSCWEGSSYTPADACPDEPSTCESIGSNCRKCLKSNCAWSVGECMDDCTFIADAPCFPGSKYKGDRGTICSAENNADITLIA